MAGEPFTDSGNDSRHRMSIDMAILPALAVGMVDGRSKTGGRKRLCAA